MKKLSTILASLCLFFSNPPAMASERALVAWQWIEQGALIIDVRTRQEFAQNHLKDAVNYPLSELEEHISDLKKDQPIVLYCQSGNRSGRALRKMKSLGFSKLHNAGGLNELNRVKK